MKFKKLDGQAKHDKYKVATNIVVLHNIFKSKTFIYYIIKKVYNSILNIIIDIF